LHSVRAVIPNMTDSGQLIFISSVAHNMISPYAAGYAASKAFVSSIAGSLRFELADRNIHVTDMLVGRTQSEFSERRLGQPGHSRSGGRIPVMTSEQVAQAIVKAIQKRPRRVALRWFDRLLMLGSLLVPDVIGRLAMRQYR